MKIKIIHSGLFKLDGGAMFGVVPKTLWTRKMEADENNMCTWAMRSLLIEHGDRKILVDTGIGQKQGEKFHSHFHPHGPDKMESLNSQGYSAEDITDVFITHFHFDHVGGAVKRNEEGELVPTFPKATYWSNERHYDWAMDPNPREAASFLKENFVPLKEQDVLSFIDVEENVEWMPGIHIRFVYGHTEAMMLLDMKVNGQRVVYAADLMPSYAHVSMPWVMAYDVRPLETLKEKRTILNELIEDNGILLFEHDAQNECASLTRDSRGRIKVDQLMDWSEVAS
jgi:glyoxylase-like metal-dependent hydrolase (beta-lactamase superfamily II)